MRSRRESAIDLIEAAWSSHGKMDWLALEGCLRDLLHEAERYDAVETLSLINEAVAAFTRRGHERLTVDGRAEIPVSDRLRR